MCGQPLVVGPGEPAHRPPVDPRSVGQPPIARHTELHSTESIELASARTSHGGRSSRTMRTTSPERCSRRRARRGRSRRAERGCACRRVRRARRAPVGSVSAAPGVPRRGARRAGRPVTVRRPPAEQEDDLAVGAREVARGTRPPAGRRRPHAAPAARGRADATVARELVEHAVAFVGAFQRRRRSPEVVRPPRPASGTAGTERRWSADPSLVGAEATPHPAHERGRRLRWLPAMLSDHARPDAPGRPRGRGRRRDCPCRRARGRSPNENSTAAGAACRDSPAGRNRLMAASRRRGCAARAA